MHRVMVLRQIRGYVLRTIRENDVLGFKSSALARDAFGYGLSTRLNLINWSLNAVAFSLSRIWAGIIERFRYFIIDVLFVRPPFGEKHQSSSESPHLNAEPSPDR